MSGQGDGAPAAAGGWHPESAAQAARSGPDSDDDGDSGGKFDLQALLESMTTEKRTTVDRLELARRLRCDLCNGLFRDPVTLPECMHSFCRACLLRRMSKAGQLDTPRPICPSCGVPAASGRPLYVLDSLLAGLVAKLFPEAIKADKKLLAQAKAREPSVPARPAPIVAPVAAPASARKPKAAKTPSARAVSLHLVPESLERAVAAVEGSEAVCKRRGVWHRRLRRPEEAGAYGIPASTLMRLAGRGAAPTSGRGVRPAGGGDRTFVTGGRVNADDVTDTPCLYEAPCLPKSWLFLSGTTTVGCVRLVAAAALGAADSRRVVLLAGRRELRDDGEPADRIARARRRPVHGRPVGGWAELRYAYRLLPSDAGLCRKRGAERRGSERGGCSGGSEDEDDEDDEEPAALTVKAEPPAEQSAAKAEPAARAAGGERARAEAAAARQSLEQASAAAAEQTRRAVAAAAGTGAAAPAVGPPPVLAAPPGAGPVSASASRSPSASSLSSSASSPVRAPAAPPPAALPDEGSLPPPAKRPALGP